MNFDTTRTYKLKDDNTAQSVAYALAEYLDSDKKMITQIMRTHDGYIVQCKGDAKAEWTKYVGLDAALSVEIKQNGEELTVTIGAEKWKEKLGIAAAGSIFFQPLVFTAGIGAIRQFSLFSDIFNFVGSFLGVEPIENTTADSTVSKDDEITCPHCGTVNRAGAIYCQGCGEKLVKEVVKCENCGAVLNGDETYCPFCGHKLS